MASGTDSLATAHLYDSLRTLQQAYDLLNSQPQSSLTSYDWIMIISAIAGIISLVFMIFLSIRANQIFRPSLEFNIGLSSTFQFSEVSDNSTSNENQAPQSDSSSRTFKKIPKKYKVSSLIFGTSAAEKSEIIFVCPYLLQNKSKLPITNVSLTLQYPQNYFVNMDGNVVGKKIELSDDKSKAKITEMGLRHSKEFGNRETNTIGEMAQVRYTIDVLRPGESIVIADPMQFVVTLTNDKTQTTKGLSHKGLIDQLRKIESFLDLCIVDVVILSENLAPISNRIKILWFKSSSVDDLVTKTISSVSAFWGGKFPKAGIYIRPIFAFYKRGKIFNPEYADIILPDLTPLHKTSTKEICYYWSDPTKFEAATAQLLLPSWNYYQLSGNADTDELIMKTTGLIHSGWTTSFSTFFDKIVSKGKKLIMRK